ncbi:GNAT family N-acetyltransferase [Christiangramia sediminis]|uniref:GNAT family N-acetyltransferase n=1 Tax=Christiangramia sediminis TaxID=2881336 RepID=A0A9X1LHM0_9FLAO|nr:GNAT family N-acetyltransferase [Christiangramia sediminis]MCB7480508.1 GNAT family N-acetyltransferase [Christiangramia sediminis]
MKDNNQFYNENSITNQGSSKEIPLFRTDRLILKKVQREDQPNIHKGLSNKDVIKYYGVQYNTLKETAEQMQWYENLERSGSGLWWTIGINESGKFCGAIGFNDYHKEYNRAEIGFWLLPEFWGKGLISEAANSMIDYLFKELKLHRLEAYVETENDNSAKALRKLNFNFEGRMIDCEVKNDRYISIDLFARINPEY